MSFYEIVFRRLSITQIKEDLHPRIYGVESARNELTRELVDISALAKRSKIPYFSEMCRDPTVKKDDNGEEKEIEGNFRCELPDINSARVVQNYYACVAYSLLSSVIVCTQEKEAAFAAYLFKANQGPDGTPSMWPLIIDCTQQFTFTIQTNFNHIELRSIEQKLAENERSGDRMSARDIAGMRVRNMMNEYLTTSFLSANEGFN